MRKRILAAVLAVLISVYSAVPLSVPARAVDPVTAVFVATSLGHLAIEAYRLWREEHPNTPDSQYPGYNPGGAVSRAAGGTTIRDDGGSSSSGTWGDDPTPTPTSVDFGRAYSEYVQELPAVGYQDDGSLRIDITGWYGYITTSSFSYVWISTDAPGYETRVSKSDISSSQTMNNYYLYSGPFSVPYEGYYTLHAPDFALTAYATGGNSYGPYFEIQAQNDNGGWYDPKVGSLTLGKRTIVNLQQAIYEAGASTSRGYVPGDIYRLRFTLSAYLYIGKDASNNPVGSAYGCYLKPTGRLYITSVPIQQIAATNEDATGIVQDYATTTRPVSVSGDYGIIGDDGTINKVTQNIVNEGSKTVYNPVTETSTTYDTWNYDYSDRSYHFSKTDTETGDTITSSVTYGDENVIIQEGDTAYTVYYITEAPAPTPTPLPTATPTQPPHVHHYTSEITTSATCTLSGIRTYICDGCGDSYTQAIPATGHAWEIKQQVATQYDDTGQLIQQGYTIYRCAACGEEYRTEDSTAPPGGTGSGSGIAAADDPELLEYASLVKSWGMGLKDAYSGYVGLLTDLFPYLPPELLMLFNFGLGALVFTGLFRRFFWR